MLRPVEGVAEAEWKSQVLSELAVSQEFTVPRPIRGDHCHWVHDGWHAMEWIPGRADEQRVDDVVQAGAAFHRALSHLERPAFVSASDDPWSRADRVAWGEISPPDEPLIARMLRECRPVHAPAQMIHGDLLGNVLFAEQRPPAVIDWTPYWRPAGWGAAIAVADAVCWHAHPLSRVSESRGVQQWRQLMLRALVFRMATLHHLGSWTDAETVRHLPVVEAVVELPE